MELVGCALAVDVRSLTPVAYGALRRMPDGLDSNWPARFQGRTPRLKAWAISATYSSIVAVGVICQRMMDFCPDGGGE
jgi:hypothetical protein